VLWGLGLPEWLTIVGLVGGLLLTFWVMARASVAYERARQRRARLAVAEQAETERGEGERGEAERGEKER
jgi:type II secretory pathway pseudopilin PulG